MNNCMLIGRLVKDVDLKYLQNGTGVAKFTLAVDKELFGEKKQQAIKDGKPTADFINITVFGKQAESCSNYLSKGSKCAVNGRINTGSYTTQTGETRYTTDVIANRVEFLNSKNQSGDSNFFDDFPDSDEMFEAAREDDSPF